MIYSRELGLKTLQHTKRPNGNHFSSPDALALYHRLKGKNQLFYDLSSRSIRYLAECLEHDNLSDLEISDAGQFRDYLFARSMSSSLVKRVFSSVKSIVNLAIREQGLTITNVFSGTFILDDGAKQRRANGKFRWLASHFGPPRGFLYPNQDFAFPRHCNDKKCNSNSASAALNGWLSHVFQPDVLSTHSDIAPETGYVLLSVQQTSLMQLVDGRLKALGTNMLRVMI